MAHRLALRRRARQDVDDAIDFYLREAGTVVASGFVDALEEGYRAIPRNPKAGSPHVGDIAGKDGLRSRRLKRYPYLIIYLAMSDRVEVWRVLHAKRDIPTSLQD